MKGGKEERLWRRTGLTVHKEIYRAEKCKFNTLLLDSKATYTDCGNDSKAISKIIDDLFRHKTTKLPAYSSAQDLASRFATFFKEKFDKIRDELPDCSDIDLNIPQDKPPSKSCTLDPIPTWIIRDAKNELLPKITDIINASLRSSEVPTSMKSSVFTPLLRKATLDPEILKNYRPVSNLMLVSKVLERVVAQRLTIYMTDNNLHEYLQSAYKPGHSTETALVKVQNDIRTSIDQHGIVILILLDLSAAFDTIDHDVLFSRMESTLGITGPALEWFRSYLGDGTLRVQIVH